MDLTYTEEGIENNIYYNKNYVSLILMLDNLIRNSFEYWS